MGDLKKMDDEVILLEEDVRSWYVLANHFNNENIADEIASFIIDQFINFEEILFSKLPFKVLLPGLIVRIQNVENQIQSCFNTKFISSVVFSNSSLSKTDFILISHALKYNTNLRYLSLDHGPCNNDEGLVAIADALKLNKNLQEID